MDVSREEFDDLKGLVNQIDEEGTKGTRVILTVQRYREIVWFGFIVLLSIAAVSLFVLYQVDVSQHHWCDTLSLLTEHPVSAPANPAADPSRQGQYLLYQDFVRLKGEFGCG